MPEIAWRSGLLMIGVAIVVCLYLIASNGRYQLVRINEIQGWTLDTRTGCTYAGNGKQIACPSTPN